MYFSVKSERFRRRQFKARIWARWTNIWLIPKQGAMLLIRNKACHTQISSSSVTSMTFKHLTFGLKKEHTVAYFKLIFVNVHHTKLNGKSPIGISLQEKETFGLGRKCKIAWSFSAISVKSALIPEESKTVTSSVWTRMLSPGDVAFTAHRINQS